MDNNWQNNSKGPFPPLKTSPQFKKPILPVMVIKSRVCLKPKVSTNGDDVRWIQETYLLPANNIEAGIKKKKKNISVWISV